MQYFIANKNIYCSIFYSVWQFPGFVFCLRYKRYTKIYIILNLTNKDGENLVNDGRQGPG